MLLERRTRDPSSIVGASLVLGEGGTLRGLEKRYATVFADSGTTLALRRPGRPAAVLDVIGDLSRAARVARPVHGSSSPAHRFVRPMRFGLIEGVRTFSAEHDTNPVLEPGGRVYLNGRAARVRNDRSSFFDRYIFRGNGTPPHLPEHVDAVTRSPMRLLTVIDDRNHCRLTTKQSAEGLDRRPADVERRRGTPSTGASRSTSGAASIGSAATSCRRTVS